MSSTQLVVLGVAAVIAFWMVGAYNRLVELRNAIGTAWTQIDREMLRRRDALLPLAGALRGPLPEEQGTFDAVLAAQAQVQAAAEGVRGRVVSARGVAALATAESVLGSALARLRALVSQHAEIAERDDIARWLLELHEAEHQLAFARQLFNAGGQAYDRALRQFPTRLLRRVFGFEAAGRL